MPEKLEDGNLEVFTFRRTKDQNTVIGIINMTGKAQTIKLNQTDKPGSYTDAFTGSSLATGEIKLTPWQYFIFTN